MASQVININRKKYAVGLVWQPVSVGTTVRIYAKSLAKNIDKKLNLYTEYREMVGLGARRFGHRATMRVAAAAVMESFSEYTSFLAMFQIPNGFYLVAARNGIILEDRVFVSEDDARAEYVKLSEIPDWGAFIAPSSWGMPRAVEKNLAEVLVGNNHVSLHSITYTRAGIWSISLIVIFLLLFMGIFKDSVKQVFSPRPQVAELNPELVAEYKRQIEEKNKELDAQFEIEKQLPPEPIVMPYELLPDVMARAELCYKAIGFVMQPITGWNQINVTCGETHVVAELKRSFGTLDEFYNVATDFMPGAFVQEIDDDTIRITATLPKLDAVSSQDERDVQTVLRDITSMFQGVDEAPQAQIVMDTLTNGVDVAEVNLVELEIKSKLTPMQFIKIFEDFGGVYLMQAQWDVAKRTWNYEVIIYAK